VGKYLTISEPAYPRRKVTIPLETALVEAMSLERLPSRMTSTHVQIVEPLEKVVYKADQRVDGELRRHRRERVYAGRTNED